jgi:hypothetical protein
MYFGNETHIWVLKPMLTTDKVATVNPKAVLDKLQSRLEVKHRVELGRMLGVPQSTMSRLELKGELPLQQILDFAISKGWSLDELFGNGGGKETADIDQLVKYTEMVVIISEKYLNSDEIKRRDLGDKKITSLRVELGKILMELAVTTKGNHAALDIACRSILTINSA